MTRWLPAGVLAMVLATLACASTPRHRIVKRERPVLTGDWEIVLPQPLAPDADENGYLPTGTLIRIALLGPTRQAIEEGRTDQVGARVTLMPPYPTDICQAPGAVSFCRSGHPVSPGQPMNIDVSVTMSAWDAKDLHEPDNELFVEGGARVGSGFALIVAPNAEWRLWLKGRDALLGQYLAIGPGGRSIAAEQRWMRAPRP